MQVRVLAAMTMILCLLTAPACAEFGPAPNPMTEFETFQALAEAAPGVALVAPPADAADVGYSTISYLSEDPIAQIAFTWNEDDYCLRAARCADVRLLDDIHGVNLDFDRVMDADELAKAVGSDAKLDGLTLELIQAAPDVLLKWMDRQSGTGYTLYSATAGNPDLRVLDLLSAWSALVTP